MTGKVSINPKIGRAILALALAGFVAGCDENGGFNFGAGAGANGADPTTEGAAQRTELVERDVEAPDVFQVTDRGLWDGRPSLGGVWVAHPDVGDPERVIIRNSTNGKFVIGALFRRERETPGPSLQVSSDAAEALGMLAGAPADLSVTALRREEPAVETPPEATTDFEAPAGVDTGEIAATPLDPIAGAAAAISAAESAAPAPAPMPAPADTVVAASDTPAATPAPAASNLSKPYIQIGIFSVEANANRTADSMRATGLVPTVLEQQSQGKPFWRVIVGPAATEAERDSLLTKVKGMGFADAYFVSN